MNKCLLGFRQNTSCPPIEHRHKDKEKDKDRDKEKEPVHDTYAKG